MSRLADYSKFDNLDDGSDEDAKPQRRDAPPPPGTARRDAPPPPGTEPGPARYYKRVQAGAAVRGTASPQLAVAAAAAASDAGAGAGRERKTWS